MAKNQKHSILPETTTIEVVMRKQMSLHEFEKMKQGARNKGWKVKVYQVGVFSEGCE